MMKSRGACIYHIAYVNDLTHGPSDGTLGQSRHTITSSTHSPEHTSEFVSAASVSASGEHVTNYPV